MLRILYLFLVVFIASAATAEPAAAPGDQRLRHDLQLLNDTGAIDIPLTAWPVAMGDVYAALERIDSTTISLESASRAALQRVKRQVNDALETDVLKFTIELAGSSEPRIVRTFENTPREEGEVLARLSWLGKRSVVILQASYAFNPFDGDEIRPDGSYVGVALGNWMVTAGWQDRWFGPGRDGSLILSTNARPTPGISIQRIRSNPFETSWLRWIGPWTLTSFMTQLDDTRTIDDAWLFGLRGSFRPVRGLEIGVTRTAQWCGNGRPCDLSTFGDLLIGNDNRGVNVSIEDEPGNQLGGFDIRWVLPGGVPVALYMQWIGEDGRGGGGAIGSWLRQLGLEYWGAIGSLSHRTHVEITDSMCKEGGFGFADDKPDCAYGHSIYRTGYRYENRAIGFAADSDSLSYSIGSTLVQSGGHVWNATLRYMEINRQGAPDARHTLTPTPKELIDVQLTHQRDTRIGRFYVGVSYSEFDDLATGASDSDLAGFFRWSWQ